MLALALCGAQLSQAQIFFTENFEGAPGANGLPAGWTETGLSTDGIWNMGNATAASSAYVTVPAAIQGTNFAYTNDDACDCNKSADRMILPVQNFTGMAGVQMIFDVFLPGVYGGVGTVEVSTNGGGTWTSISTIATSASWSNDVIVSLSAYAGMTNVMISFKYNDMGGWADAMGVDEVRLEQLTVTNPDMTIASTTGSEYTIVPISQITSINLAANVTNVGSASATDANVTVKIYDITNMSTPVQTTTSANSPVNVGASANLTAGTFTPPGSIVDYVFQYITTATGDINAVNDTSYRYLSVTQNVYGRDDSNPTASFGIGAGPSGYLGSKYTFTAATPIDSVWAVFNKPGTSTASGDGVGDSTKFVIYNVAGGLPTTVIGQSDAYVFTPADTLGLSIVQLKVNASGGGTLTLAPGTYFFAVQENNTNVGLTFTDDNFQLTTYYFSWVGQAWTPAENFPAQFQKVPMIRPILGCSSVDVVSTEVSCNGGMDGAIDITVTGAGPFTYTWSNGSTTEDLSGLIAGSYTGTVTDNNGCESSVGPIVITEPTAVSGTTNVTNESSAGANDGAIDLTPAGGTPPYTFLWSNSATTEDITGLTAGTYTCTITDANGCSEIVSADVMDSTNSISMTNIGINEIKLFPNPATTQIALEINFEAVSSVAVKAVSANGQEMTTLSANDVLNTEFTLNVETWSNGVYFLHIETELGVSTIRFVKN